MTTPGPRGMRWRALILTTVAAFGVAACGSDAKSTATGSAPAASTTAASASSATSSATTASSGGATTAANTSAGTTAPTTAKPTSSVDHATIATELSLSNLDGLNSGSVTFTRSVYSSLVYVDPTGKIVPDVATDWTASPDATVWTFNIRPNIQFSDGSPLTAEDVLYTFQHLIADTKSTQYVYVSQIQDIKQVGTSQIVITLKASNAGYLRQAAYANLVPSDSYDKTKFTTAPIGSGPYKVDSYNGTDTVELSLNDHYYGTPGKIPHVTMQTVADQTTRLNGLQSGQFDVATLTGNNVSVAKSAGLVVDSVPSSRVTYLGYNVVDTPILSSLKLRQAISLAIDRQSLVDNILLGLGQTDFQLLTPTVYGYDPAIKVPTPDIAQAKQLVADSGYKGEQIIFNYPATSYVVSPDLIAQAIQANLAEIGLNVKLESQADDTFLSNWLERGALKGMWLFSATTTSLDGGGTFNFMVNRVNTFTDDSLAKLFVAQGSETDIGKRAAILGQISKTINDNAYYTPMFAETYNFVHTAKIKLDPVPAHGYTYAQLLSPA